MWGKVWSVIIVCNVVSFISREYYFHRFQIFFSVQWYYSYTYCALLESKGHISTKRQLISNISICFILFQQMPTAHRSSQMLKSVKSVWTFLNQNTNASLPWWRVWRKSRWTMWDFLRTAASLWTKTFLPHLIALCVSIIYIWPPKMSVLICKIAECN